jgi:hypothetical protein
MEINKDTYAMGAPQVRGKLRIESNVEAFAVARCAAGSKGIFSIDDVIAALISGTETFVLTCDGGE